MAFIPPPSKIPWYLRLGILVAKKVTGKDLLPPRLLAWYPLGAVGAGVLEALAAHPDGLLDERMLKLVRIQVSLAVSCPFCIDMNSYNHIEAGVTDEELNALRRRIDPAEVPTFSERERLALEYVRRISVTPLVFSPDFVEKLRSQFNEREMVILATTAAQVNYWARLLQALGVPPAGFNQ